MLDTRAPLLHRQVKTTAAPSGRGGTAGALQPAAPAAAAPAPAAESPLSNDVLGCVFRFIRDHVHDEHMEPLKPEQILRSWNSSAIAPQTSEYCILTHTGTVRHGTNAYTYAPPPEGDTGSVHTAKFLEHFVQVDFFCSDQSAPPDLTRRRAHILELLANSQGAAGVFGGMNAAMSCMYADDVQDFNELDEAHRMRQRHMVTLHIGETFSHKSPQQFISGVRLYLNEVVSSTNTKDTTNGGTT